MNGSSGRSAGRAGRDDEQNEFGCPLRYQSGAAAVKDFAGVLARLSPELRAAFEAERAARQAELDQYVRTCGYHT